MAIMVQILIVEIGVGVAKYKPLLAINEKARISSILIGRLRDHPAEINHAIIILNIRRRLCGGLISIKPHCHIRHEEEMPRDYKYNKFAHGHHRRARGITNFIISNNNKETSCAFDKSLVWQWNMRRRAAVAVVFCVVNLSVSPISRGIDDEIINA